MIETNHPPEHRDVLKENVVFIPGMWGTARCWDGFKPYFDERRFVCRPVTLPWHDQKEKGSQADWERLGEASLTEYVEALRKQLELLTPKPIVIGHSMGGWIAQKLAAEGLVKAAVLLAPAPPAGIRALDIPILWRFWRPHLWAILRAQPMRPTFKRASYAMLHCLPPDKQQAVFNNFVFESGRAAREIGLPWIYIVKKPSAVDQSKVTCPMLIMAGTEDRITPVRVARRVAAKYAGAAYRECPGRAHWLMDEPGHEEVFDHLLRWLEEHVLTRGS
jgi:pimeloyl-ACP methyl ester carboxylesterase